MTARDTLDLITDRGALLFTVLVGIGTTVYLSASITPDLWSQIVMGILGGGLPLISVRFLIKRKFRFFWLTVGLIVFCDVSMVLSLTANQAHAVVTQATTDAQTPPALKRLQDASDKAQATLDELIRQQDEAKQRGTLDNLDGQITRATESRDQAQAREAAWQPPVETRADRVNSHDVFMSIPVALMSLDLSRYMTLVFALLVAVVYQGTVIATVNATVKSVKRETAQAAEAGKKKRRKPRAPRVAEAETPAPLEIEPVAAEDFDPEATEAESR